MYQVLGTHCEIITYNTKLFHVSENDSMQKYGTLTKGQGSSIRYIVHLDKIERLEEIRMKVYITDLYDGKMRIDKVKWQQYGFHE